MSKGSNLSRIAAAGAAPRKVGTTAVTPKETTRLTVDVDVDVHADLHAFVGRAAGDLRRRVTASNVVRELIGELHDSPELAARVLERLRGAAR